MRSRLSYLPKYSNYSPQEDEDKNFWEKLTLAIKELPETTKLGGKGLVGTLESGAGNVMRMLYKGLPKTEPLPETSKLYQQFKTESEDTTKPEWRRQLASQQIAPPPDFKDTSVGKISQRLMEGGAKKQAEVSKESQEKLTPLSGDWKKDIFDPRWVARLATQVTPQILATTGAGLGTLALTKNPQAALLVGTSMGFAQNSGEMYNNAKELGLSEEEAQEMTDKYTTIATAMDTLPITKILDDVPGGDKLKNELIRRVMSDAISEGVQETGQQAWQNVLLKEKFPEMDITEGLPESFFGGALSGGAVGGIQTVGNVYDPNASPQKMQTYLSTIEEIKLLKDEGKISEAEAKRRTKKARDEAMANAEEERKQKMAEDKGIEGTPLGGQIPTPLDEQISSQIPESEQEYIDTIKSVYRAGSEEAARKMYEAYPNPRQSFEEMVGVKSQTPPKGVGESFFEYQNKNLEPINKRGFNESGLNPTYHEKIENAGDIGRELSLRGDGADPGYIGEKINKLKKLLNGNDPDMLRWYKQDLDANGNPVDVQKQAEIIKQYKQAYENYPGKLSPTEQKAKELTLAIVDKDIPRAKKLLADFEKIYTTQPPKGVGEIPTGRNADGVVVEGEVKQPTKTADQIRKLETHVMKINPDALVDLQDQNLPEAEYETKLKELLDEVVQEKPLKEKEIPGYDDVRELVKDELRKYVSRGDEYETIRKTKHGSTLATDDGKIIGNFNIEGYWGDTGKKAKKNKIAVTMRDGTTAEYDFRKMYKELKEETPVELPEIPQEYERGLKTKVEKQIDDLVGYQDSGRHWKLRFHERQKYIDAMMEQAPKEVQAQLKRLQEISAEQSRLYQEMRDASDEAKGIVRDDKGRVKYTRKVDEKKAEPAKKKAIKIGKKVETKMQKLSDEIETTIAPVLAGFGGVRSDMLPTDTATEGELQWEKQEPFTYRGGRQTENVFKREFGIPIKTTTLFKSSLGKFYPQLDKAGKLIDAKIKVVNLSDYMTVAHELGHYLDFALGRAFSGKKGDRGLLSYNKPLRTELIGVSEAISPIVGSESYIKYRKSSKELIAQYISMYANDQKRAKQLAPEFTKLFERAITENDEISFALEQYGRWNKKFQQMVDYVNNVERTVGRDMPEIQKRIGEFKMKGKMFEAVYDDMVGDGIWNWIENQGEKVRLSKKAGGVLSWFFENGQLPTEVAEVFDQRRMIIDGQQNRILDEYVSEFEQMTKEEQQEMAEKLQDFETRKEGDKFTEKTRKELVYWGWKAKRLGLLKDQTFWDNVGQYFPFFYEKNEFDENSKRWGRFDSNKFRADMSSTKKKMTDYDWGMKYLENKYGTWPSGKKKIESFSKPQVEAWGRQAREDFGLIKEAGFPVVKRLNQMIQMTTSIESFNMLNKMGYGSNEEVPGWVKLGKEKSLGDLAGKYVPESLANEINSWSRSGEPIGKILSSIVNVWKTFKVAWNPATVARNIVSNFLVSWMGGAPTYQPGYWLDAITSYSKKDKTYQTLRNYGLYQHTITNQELADLSGMIKESKNGHQAYMKVASWAMDKFDKPAEFYGFLEELGKTALASYAMKNGATPQQAVKYANKWLFDYSKTSKLVGKARKGPLPFVTWGAKMFPRMVETLVRDPWKPIGVMVGIAMFNKAMRERDDLTEEELEAMRKGYLNRKGTNTVYLGIDPETKEIQEFDMSYILPWGAMMQMSQGIPEPMVPRNLWLSAYEAFVSNWDSFYMQEVVPEYELGTSRGWVKKFAHLGEAFFPSLTPVVGSEWQKGVRAIRKEGDFYGRYRTFKEWVAGLAGLKTSRGGMLEVERKLNEKDDLIQQINKQENYIDNHAGFSPEYKEKQIEWLEERKAEIETDYDELMEIYNSLYKKGITSPEPKSQERTTTEKSEEKEPGFLDNIMGMISKEPTPTPTPTTAPASNYKRRSKLSL